MTPGGGRVTHIVESEGRRALVYSKMKPAEKRALCEGVGACQICGAQGGTPDTPRLVVDHDHDSGHVRGVVCGRCNGRLGWVDSLQPEWLNRAREYLGSPPTSWSALCGIVENHYLQNNAEWLAELAELETKRNELTKQINESNARVEELRSKFSYTRVRRVIEVPR